MEISASVWLLGGGLLLQTIVLSITGTWFLGKTLDKLRENIRSDRKEIDHSMALIENDLREEINARDRESRQLIDSVQRILTTGIDALRTSLHANELYVRENYVRRESFYKVADEIKALVTGRMDNLDTKLDAHIQRQLSRG